MALALGAATAPPSPVPVASPNLIAVPAEGGLVLPPVPAVGPSAPPRLPPPSGDIAGANQQPFVGIALSDAIAMALVRNTDLAVSQADRRIAAYRVVAAEGAYDVRFQVEPQYTASKVAALSSFMAGPNGGQITQVTAGAAGGFSGLTPSGGSFRASTSAERVNNDVTLNSYDPYYETSLALQFAQPLARNRAIDDTRRQIQLAKIGVDVSTDAALLTASNSISNVSNAYADLLAAWRNVGIQEDALRQARAQSQSNARLVRRGAAARVDVAESDSQVAQFQDEVYAAIQNVASLQNQLKSLILNDPADPLWTANLVPTSPLSPPPPEPAVDDVVVAALRNRPEVAQLRDNIRQQDVNVAYERDQTKPQIDLNVGVTENGFAGAPTGTQNNSFFNIIGTEIAAIDQLIARSNAASPGATPLVPISPSGLNAPLFPGSVGKLGRSYATALAGEYPTYTAGLTLSFPLRNRTAEASLAAERERRGELQTQEVGLIQRVQYEARNAVQAYRSARSRVLAAGAARAAAEIVAASEIRKFRAGASTTFLVLQRQVTLANQRGREVRAQTDLERARVEIDRVSGTILANNRVDASALGTAPQGTVPNLLAPAAGSAPAAGRRR